MFSSKMIPRRLSLALLWCTILQAGAFAPALCPSSRACAVETRLCDASSSSSNDNNPSPQGREGGVSNGGGLAEEESLIAVGDWEDCQAIADSSQVYQALQDRLLAMERGIGKRYRCRTQKGWLNVHQEPGDPYNAHNVVGQLREGDIVTSVGPNRGPWVRHDGGGWSIAIFGGFTWLEELQD